MKNYRHGDVNISKVDSLEGFSPRKNNVLAYGEVTGHSHKVLPKTKDDVVEVYENEKGELAFKVKGIAVVTHEEHKTIEIGEGLYLINNEREYDYWALSTRKVQD